MKAKLNLLIVLVTAGLFSHTGCTNEEAEVTGQVEIVQPAIPSCTEEYTEQNVTIEELSVWMTEIITNNSQIMHFYDRPWADQTPREFLLVDIWKYKVNEDFYYYYTYIPTHHTGDNFMPKLLTYIYDCEGNEVCYDDHLINLGCDFELDYEIGLYSSDLFDYYIEQDLEILTYTEARWTL